MRITADASCRSQLDACANHGTGWVYDNEPKQRVNVDNMSCQLKSVEEVGKLWEAHYLKHPEEYAGVVFMRPDVQYQCDFPVHVIPDLKVCSWLSVCFRHLRLQAEHSVALALGSTRQTRVENKVDFL